MNDRIVVKPGIYLRGDVDYFSIDAVNFSTLKYMSVSPKLYQHRRKFPKRATSGMRLGTSAHTAVLEPDRFMLDYALYEAPADEKTGKKKSDRRGTKAYEAFVNAHHGKTVIKRDEYMQAIAIRDAVRAHPVARRYLESGHPEAAIVWVDEETGLLCKGRVDWLCDDPDVPVDLKSTGDITSFRFCRYASALDYHVQAAFYADGYARAAVKLKEGPRFKVIAVEQARPAKGAAYRPGEHLHDVAVYNVPTEVLDAGRNDYREWMRRLIHCRETGRYPGYAEDGELDFQLPPWRLQDENDIESIGLEM